VLADAVAARRNAPSCKLREERSGLAG